MKLLADRVTIALCCGLATAALGLIGLARVNAGDGLDPIFEKPSPITMAELAKRTTPGVSALPHRADLARPRRGLRPAGKHRGIEMRGLPW